MCGVGLWQQVVAIISRSVGDIVVCMEEADERALQQQRAAMRQVHLAQYSNP